MLKKILINNIYKNQIDLKRFKRLIKRAYDFACAFKQIQNKAVKLSFDYFQQHKLKKMLLYF